MTQKTIAELSKTPKRDISHDLVVQEFLSKHKVHVTLAISPTRISEIHQMIATLDLTHVEKVLVNFPKRFGRDKYQVRCPKRVESQSKGKDIKKHCYPNGV